MLLLKDTGKLTNEVKRIITKETTLKKKSVRPYAKMQYPSVIPSFKFEVESYLAENVGTVFLMQTKAVGNMYLMTLVFTPSNGEELPVLLIDCMSFLGKRTVFVEYYDCTVRKEPSRSLMEVERKYAHLPDYAEKEAWYIPLRTSYSLIKGNTKKEEQELIKLLFDEVRTYIRLGQKKKMKDQMNLAGLREFQNSMITKGNPSSKILAKVLGEEGARTFFCKYIMPINEKE